MPPSPLTNISIITLTVFVFDIWHAAAKQRRRTTPFTANYHFMCRELFEHVKLALYGRHKSLFKE